MRVLVKLPNSSHINQVFEQVGIAYASRLEPGTEAFTAATRKRKVNAPKKVTVKKGKGCAREKSGCGKDNPAKTETWAERNI
jgi:hypothetical protein